VGKERKLREDEEQKSGIQAEIAATEGECTRKLEEKARHPVLTPKQMAQNWNWRKL